MLIKTALKERYVNSKKNRNAIHAAKSLIKRTVRFRNSILIVFEEISYSEPPVPKWMFWKSNKR